MIAFEHSVFALPFALLAVWSATDGAPPVAGTLWVIVAMVAARTFAMAINRIVDRHLDANNPRTAQRELVTGALTTRAAWGGVTVSVAVFAVALSQLDPITWPLAPIALAALAIYPYWKRWTWAAHFGLGFAQAIAPVGAWLAITGELTLAAVLLGLAVGAWMAGFDLIYATQDVESDRVEGVHSFPADFTIAGALTLSRVMHVTTVALWVAFGLAAELGALWWTAVAIGAAMLAYEQSLVRPDDLTRVNRAFFTVNGYVAIVIGALGIADTIIAP
jgi:4-hydroxybenzoate polyprenyltransferase